MDEQNSDPPELSPATLTVLEDILRSQRPLRPVDAWLPDVPQSVRYLTGALSAEEVQAIDAGLNATREARDRLRWTRATLRKLQVLSWAEVAARAEADDEVGAVARAWIELVSKRIGAAQRAPAWWRSRDWTAIRQEVTAGFKEAQAAWMAFLSFIEQWKLAMGRPLVAVAKGGDQTSAVLGNAAVEGADISAEIDQGGALRLRLVLPSSSGKPDASVFNKQVHLALALNGEVWPLAVQTIEAETTELVVPAVGTVLDLPAGRIPSQLIRVEIGDVDLQPQPERWTLLAEVWDRNGKPAPGSPAAIELSDSPRWEAGRVNLQISIPADVRDAFPAHDLELELIFSSHDAQHLGVWPVSQWGEDTQILTLVCPGSPDAAVPFASCLRARLRARPVT